MMNELNGAVLVDEIDRLFVVYEKAKEYLTKISAGIDQQIDLWQHRRQIVVEQINSSSSFDFLLPKTQRINELNIDAVQALCRVDLLVEQILRIDPKNLSQARPMPTSSSSFSVRSNDTNVSHLTTNTMLSRNHQPAYSPSSNLIRQQQQQSYYESVPNGKIPGQQTLPIPVLRTSQQTPSSRWSLATAQEKAGFKPIEQQQQSSLILDNTSRPTPIHPQTNHRSTIDGPKIPHSVGPSYGNRTPQSDYITSPMITGPTTSLLVSGYPQAPRGKVKVKLQRIPAGTKWKQAKIDVIDSLSAFYVENYDPIVHEKFAAMQDDLHCFYDNLERTNNLMPLKDVSIGDFGVAKYTEDRLWYRARLLTCEDNNRVKIVFIDFGNIESKPIEEFFPLDPLFTDLPAQGIACTLSEAFPRSANEIDPLWPQDTIQIFRQEVTDKFVEVSFVALEEGTEQWPLHFVRLTVNNQTITSLLNLKQRIEPRPNRFIATQLASSLTHQEYILFNVLINEDESE